MRQQNSGKSEDFMISDEQGRNTCVSPACPALRLKKETSLALLSIGASQHVEVGFLKC